MISSQRGTVRGRGLDFPFLQKQQEVTTVLNRCVRTFCVIFGLLHRGPDDACFFDHLVVYWQWHRPIQLYVGFVRQKSYEICFYLLLILIVYSCDGGRVGEWGEEME